MAGQHYGEPHYFYDRKRHPEDDTHIQCARNDEARYGASIESSYVSPNFLSCHQLLQIEAFILANRAWIQEHAECNEEQSASQVVSGIVYVRLKHLDNPDNQVTLSFFKEDHHAYYGTPVQAGSRDWQEYPKSQWVECADRRRIE